MNTVCRNRLNKAKGRQQPVYSCKEHVADLVGYTGVQNISTNDSNIFPQLYCNPCHSRLNRAQRATNDGVPFPSISAMEWSPHPGGLVSRNYSIKIMVWGENELKEKKKKRNKLSSYRIPSPHIVWVTTKSLPNLSKNSLIPTTKWGEINSEYCG